MPTELGPLSQAAKQCQFCHKSESPEVHLLSCAGCSRSHYCDKECQRKDWPNHKATCKLNREAKARMKEEKGKAVETNASQDRESMLVALVESKLKPFLQIHRAPLMWALVQALQLQLHPERIDTHVLYISLAPTFKSNPSPSADVTKLFQLQSTLIATFSETFELLTSEPAVYPALSKNVPALRQQQAALKIQSESVQANGGMGVGAILVVCGPIAHFSPVGITDRDLSSIKIDADWEKTFRSTLQKGIRM